MNSYSFNQISDKYPVLGIVTAICMLGIAVMLQYTQRLLNIDHYLVGFNCFKTNRRLLKFVTVLYYFAAIIPTMLLVAWVTLLFIGCGISPALPVLLNGLFFNILILPCKDSLYYYKLFLISLLFVAAQLTTIFTADQWLVSTTYSYFSVSAVLLILNGCLVSITMWVIKGKSWELQESLPPIKDEFVQWCPTWMSTPHPLILTGGFYSTLCKHSHKNWITFGIYIISLLCLVALALVIYYASPFGILGAVTAIAVATTDLIILLIANLENELFVSPNVVSLLILMIRICLFGFTSDYWFMGYCLLYVLLMTYIFYLIIDKNYPSFEKIPTMEVKRTNVLKMPQTVGIIGTVLFSAIIFYLGIQNQIEIPVTTIKIGSVDQPYWAVGIGAIVFTIALYFYLASLRLLQRRRNHIREFSGYYLGCGKFSEYYMYALMSYVMIVIFGCYFYVTVGNPMIWLATVFLPLIYEAFLQFYHSWQQNDYSILGNVEKYNIKMKKRSDAQDNLKKRQNEMMQKMKQNTKTAGFFKQQKISDKVAPTSTPDENNNDTPKALIPQEASAIKLQPEEEKPQLFESNEPKVSSFQPINDWRKDESFCQALFQGKLLPTDKKILISLPIIIALMAIFSVICLLVYKESLALTISAQMLFLLMALLPMKKFFSTLQWPQALQIIMFCLGVVINFGFGAIGLINNWRNSTVWIIWWGFVNPLLLCIYALWGLVRDYGVTAASIITAIFMVLIGFGMGIFILISGNLIAGIAVIGVMGYVAYFLAIGLYYINNNNSLPRIFFLITAILMVLTALAVMIVGFILPEFDDFLGFSITYMVLTFLLLGYSAYLLLNDISTRIEAPNFYSPYGLPIYKYRGDLGSCQSNRLPLVLYVIGLFVLYIYCILVEIFVNPSNLGVSLSCIFQVLMFVSAMYFLTYNSYQAGIIKEKITNDIVVESWTKEKEVQIKLKQIVSTQEGSLMKHMRQQLNQLQATYQFETDAQKKTQLLVQISDLEYKLDKETNEELLVGVNLWVRCLSRVQGLDRKEMLKLVTFVNRSADILASIGIVIIVDNVLDIESKYRQAKSDYNLLAPEQKIKFDFAFSEWQNGRAKKDQMDEQKSKEHEEEKRKRDADIIKKLQEQHNDKQDDSKLPIDKMRDSPAKLKKMLDTYKGNNFYSDPIFKADKVILPEDIRTQCRNFSRPQVESFLMDDSDGAFDVRQGAIGNCYLISAIGILSRKYCEKLLGIGEWECPTGAYMVRLKKLGRDIYVIIDNQFPVGVDDTWLLGRCENDKELYVNVIEKAFAKLYGGYDKIIGGKVNITLAEMTGGFPEQIKLSKYQQSGADELFNRLLNYYKMGYLMGAGSPENAQGDSVIVEGIVQGHAYQIVKISDIDGNKLIKLRNPHGNEGCEWTGDWSDKSEKWSQRLLELVKESMVQDGAFWMCIDDFVYCYKSLYICRIFEPDNWKTVSVEGKWQGQKAAGMPSKTNPGALINKNPHYGIKAYKKCTLFVEVQQDEMQGSWKGKNFIYYMVQRNAGKRIKTISVDKLCGKSDSAVNTSTISGQIELEAASYPYIFSLVVACINAGDEGSFDLSIYCNDMNMEVIDDKDFDV